MKKAKVLIRAGLFSTDFLMTLRAQETAFNVVYKIEKGRGYPYLIVELPKDSLDEIAKLWESALLLLDEETIIYINPKNEGFSVDEHGVGSTLGILDDTLVKEGSYLQKDGPIENYYNFRT